MRLRGFVLSIVAIVSLLPRAHGAGLTEETRIDLQQETPAFRRYLVRGWHSPDAGAAWTGRDKLDATIRIPVAPGFGYDVLVFPSVVPTDRCPAPYEIQILVNDRVVRTMSPAEASALIEMTVPESALNQETVDVAIRAPLFCPNERGESPDDRWLGIKVHRVDIFPWRKDGVAMKGEECAVGIFSDPDVPHMGAPSDPAFLASLLRDAGIPVRMLLADELSSVSVLDRDRMDLVVLPYGPAFPATARHTFQRFLRHGGSFIAMGGYALDHLYGEGFGEELLENPQFDGGWAGWRPVDGVPGVKMEFDAEKGRTRPGSARLQVDPSAPVTWYALTADLPRLQAGTCIALNGFARTEGVREGYGAYAALSFYDAKGTRIAWADTNLLLGASPWTRLRTQANVPEGTERTVVSLLLHGRGTAWFDDLHVCPVPASLNTRGGRPADFLEVEPDQISVFDAGYPLEHAVAIRPGLGQNLFRGDVGVDAPLSGMAAVGMTGAQWYCTSQEKCRILPLLQSFDRFGRPRGPAGALMLNHRGLYKGSCWAFFGVDNLDLFSADHPALCQGFVRLAQRLRQPLFLHETASDLACYRDGEAVALSAQVDNAGRLDREVTVCITVRGMASSATSFSERIKVSLSPGASETVQAQWHPERFEEDLYRIEAVLLEGEGEIDREETNGFAIWKDEVIQSAPRLSLQDNVFRIGDRPLFMTGAQQFWASLSVLNCSPLTIAWDFKGMRDHGVRLARSFMMWQLRPDQEERRFRDMMVYLAHKYRVVMFHEGTGSFPPTSDDLAKEKERARFLAERYGDLPLFCVDHRNEPSLLLEDSERQNAWLTRFVADKYNGAAPYDAVRVSPLSGRWGDLRSYDIAMTGANEMARWSRELSDAMHAVQPHLLTSVGFLQENSDAAVIKDPLWASDGLDFMNRHFYGPLSRFPSQFKEMDMRVKGMPPSTGEFGSRTHPTGGGNFESKEDQFTRYEFISHYALGLGGAFVSNWHWRDPWESIFSYGIMRQDHAPKDIAKVYRQISLLFASIEPVALPLEVFVVLPDRHRLSYPPLSESLYRAFDEMMSLRVDFGVIREGDLDRIPGTCRAILFPLPYLSEDQALDRLASFVRQGGFLYLSGDLCYDAKDLQRRRPERLLAMCGVEAEEPEKKGLADLGPADEPIRPTGLLPGVSEYTGRHPLALGLRGAHAVSMDGGGRPVAALYGLGAGQVLFTSDPLELDAEVLSSSGMYRAFLRLAGVKGHEVVPADPLVHCFQVGTRRGRAFVVYNRHAARPHEPFQTGLPKMFAPEDISQVAIQEADLALGLAPMKPGFAHVASDGALLAVESQGPVAHRGAPVIETDTHVTALSLDGRDLGQSEHLAIIGLYPGTVRLASEVKGLQAEIGEIRDGEWVTLEEMPVNRDSGRVIVSFDGETALEIALLGTDLEKTRQLLRELAGF